MTKRSRAVPLSRTFLGLATATLVAASLAGCTSEDDVLYCVDEWGVVQSEEHCDGDSTDDQWDHGGGAYFIHIGRYPTGVQPGTKLPGVTSGTMPRVIAHSDADARIAAGIPARGGFGGSGSESGGGAGG